MAQVIYAKYNKLRQKEFRVRTCIYQEEKERWVEKAALCPEAEEHIRRMMENRPKLEKCYPQLEFVQASETADGVRFEYLTGQSLDDVLAKKMVSKEKLKSELTNLLVQILPDEKKWEPFQATAEFERVFGSGAGLEGRLSASTVNIDCLLENMLVKDGRIICLDYEWVFDFAIPIDFIRYRVVHYFYQGHPEANRLLAEKELLAEWGLTEQDCSSYAAMELEFQHYVFGGEYDCRYTENYRQPVVGFDEVLAEKEQTEREKEELRKVVNHYEQVERKLRKIGLWQLLQGVQKIGRKIKGIFRRTPES